MSKPNMTKVIRGLMKDNKIQNSDLNTVLNSTRPNKKYYMQQANSAFYKLGVDDYYPAIFLLMPLSLVVVYHVTTSYFLYGIKPWMFSNGFYTNYNAINMSLASKTNPDAHYSQQWGVYTIDRLHGLRTLPKRPWEMFKDPENTMKRVAYKHNRENTNF